MVVTGVVVTGVVVTGVAPPVLDGHSAVGIGELTASHAFGYVHPCTCVGARPVSPASNHPFPALTDGEGLGENVGGGSVGTALVDV